jgi:hypothetical protein
MHHICEVLDWPTVHDLYPFVGMRAERRTKCKSPAKPRTVKSLAAPAKAAQGACTLVDSTCHQRVTGQAAISEVRRDYVLEAAGMCLDAPILIPRGSLKGYGCYPSGYQVDSVDFRGGAL